MFKLTLKDHLDFNAALSTLRQLDAVIEWVEPNYIVKRAGLGLPPPTRLQPRRATPRSAASVSSTLIAVIDSGLDTRHPDLKRHLAINPFEQAGVSGHDDDRNGFADDLRGWNFVADNLIRRQFFAGWLPSRP